MKLRRGLVDSDRQHRQRGIAQKEKVVYAGKVVRHPPKVAISPLRWLINKKLLSRNNAANKSEGIKGWFHRPFSIV